MALLSSTFMPAMATDKANEPPNMALLEYLAGLVEVDGELVGPLDIAPVTLSEEQATSPDVNDKKLNSAQDENATKKPSATQDNTHD